MKKLDLVKVLEFEFLAGKFFARTCVLRGEFWRDEVDAEGTRGFGANLMTRVAETLYCTLKDAEGTLLRRHRNYQIQDYDYLRGKELVTTSFRLLK